MSDWGETLSAAGFAALLIFMMWAVFTSDSDRDDARREACSYRCNLRHGRWPARLEWKGRDKDGRIECECLYEEVPR